MALGIIEGRGPARRPTYTAAAYFERFPREPLINGEVVVSPVARLTASQGSFEGILGRLVRCTAGQDVVLVCDGNDHCLSVMLNAAIIGRSVSEEQRYPTLELVELMVRAADGMPLLSLRQSLDSALAPGALPETEFHILVALGCGSRFATLKPHDS